MEEVAKIATSLIAIDAKLKSTETALSTHKHKFADLLEKPTTLGGYGITDGMTATEVAAAIQQAISDLVNGSGAALDTLKELADALGNDPQFATTVGKALGLRVRVDDAQSFTLAQKTQGRSNLDALGIVDKGKADGVASLDSTGKVPSAQLPALTTTATVGAAVAGANAKSAPADGDFFTGVAAGGGSTMFKTTWGNIKSVLQAIYDGRYLRLIGGTLSGALKSNSDFETSARYGSASYWSTAYRVILEGRSGGSSDGDYKAYFDFFEEPTVKAGGRIVVHGYDGRKDFEFRTNGDAAAPRNVYAGNSYLDTTGNIIGSAWNALGGSTNAIASIGNRINTRYNDAVNQIDPKILNWMRARREGYEGTYAFCRTTYNRVTWGQQVPGSALKPAGVFPSGALQDQNLTLGGSWICLGYSEVSAPQAAGVTLYYKIAD